MSSTATWSSGWTLEETTNYCSMSCATSSKQVRGLSVSYTHTNTERALIILKGLLHFRIKIS